jgi:8-oxo-dGTP pyrophosphatase MutT (NUDIX family)
MLQTTMSWLRAIEPYLRPWMQVYARLRRGLVLGVRGLVLDDQGRVLLIEHTYIKGWYMPGGGVERGETVETALAREMVEEAGVEIIGRPTLLSIHDNRRLFPGDHVLIYRIEAWRQVAATQKGEIAQLGFFAPDALPEGTTRATRNRIAEALQEAPVDPFW